MAWLKNVETQRREYLAERSLIGRSELCWIHIPHRSVSKEHAVLAAEPQGWSLKDLGSRNGTWLNGVRLDAGINSLVERGARIRIGDVDFIVDDVESPVVCACSLEKRDYRVAEMGMMILPDEETPKAAVYETAGAWVLDVDGRTQAVLDGDTAYFDTQRYRFHVPSVDAQRVTMASTIATRGRMVVSELKLQLDVSSDQESIATHFIANSSAIQVPARATHQVLLVLARQRLHDRAQGVTENECGWVYADELAKMLGSDPQRLNVDVHRLRQQFAKLGVLDAARLVERRPTSHQIRIGIAQLELS